MKHAGPAAFERLASLLEALRRNERLREQRPGVFYLRSRAFLHFHEDPSGLFADARLGDDFSRHPVTTARQQRELLRRIGRHLSALPAARER